MITVEPGPFSTPEVVAWIADTPASEGERVVRQMCAALLVHPSQSAMTWSMPGCSVAMLAGGVIADEELAPARTPAGDALWMTGEIFDWPSHPSVASPGRTIDARRALLDALIGRGASAIADADGEFLILWWTAATRTMRVLRDRFGSFPAYVARSARGAAIATGVRGVLMAPGVEARPDGQALKEAVTFGGFRLGVRTNIAGVEMLTPAAVVTVTSDDDSRGRYWRWRDVVESGSMSWDDAIDRLQERWTRAVSRRLAGARRPGLHLSGGVDSRAVLGETARHPTAPATITFGLPESDEVIYAAKAAAAVRVPWTLVPIFKPGDDWVARRASFVQQTDGLIDLSDLRHLESLETQARLLDVHLSGYFGDSVVGPRYGNVSQTGHLLSALPFYGGELGMDVAGATVFLEEKARVLEGAALRFFMFEHKLPQSLNRWTAAWRPWIGVRKPFAAYDVFDFCQRLPSSMRASGLLRNRWARREYPELFATIPEQRTGVPILTPWPLWQLARVKRAGRRRLLAAGRWVGINGQPRYRDATPDHIFWRERHAAERISEPILRRDSIACDLFGRDRVERVVSAYFSELGAPTQVIGALFSFETYHRGLADHLREARAIVEARTLRMRQVPA